MLGSKDFTDQEIIANIRDGGQSREQMVKFLLEKHLGFIIKARRKFRISEEDAYDVYGDAITDIVTNIERGKFRMDSKLSTYLFRIIQYKCMDLLRKKTTHTVEMQEDAYAVKAQADIVNAIIVKEDMRKLGRLLDKMGEPCKQILLDWGFWGYSMEEIANRVGMRDASQVKKKKYKCLQQLRKLAGYSKQ